jgi:hypothetical protein
VCIYTISPKFAEVGPAACVFREILLNVCCYYMNYCMQWFASLGIECDAFWVTIPEVVVASSFLG